MSLQVVSRGASGSLKPEIVVTAPAGSALAVKRSGTTVSTYTLGAAETQHTFHVKIGTYTVQGALGEQTASVTVVVSQTGQYPVTISYKPHYTLLYDYGDECEDVTGGWTQYSYDVTRADGDKNQWRYFRTTNSIDLAAYTKFGLFGKAAGWHESYVWYTLFVPNLSNINNEEYYFSFPQTPSGVFYLNDMASVETDNAYVMVGVSWTSGYTFTGTFTKNADNLYVYSNQGGRYNSVTAYMAALFEADDWQTVCSIAGVTAPETMDALLADASALGTILSNSAAVNAMVAQCTGDFMVSALSSTTFLTALNASPYKSTVESNEHWAKFKAILT